jgi:hypothetical protein
MRMICANGEMPASQNVDMRGLQRAPSWRSDTKAAAPEKAVTSLDEPLIISHSFAMITILNQQVANFE